MQVNRLVGIGSDRLRFSVDSCVEVLRASNHSPLEESRKALARSLKICRFYLLQLRDLAQPQLLHQFGPFLTTVGSTMHVLLTALMRCGAEPELDFFETACSDIGSLLLQLAVPLCRDCLDCDALPLQPKLALLRSLIAPYRLDSSDSCSDMSGVLLLAVVCQPPLSSQHRLELLTQSSQDILSVFQWTLSICAASQGMLTSSRKTHAVASLFPDLMSGARPSSAIAPPSSLPLLWITDLSILLMKLALTVSTDDRESFSSVQGSLWLAQASTGLGETVACLHWYGILQQPCTAIHHVMFACR